MRTLPVILRETAIDDLAAIGRLIIDNGANADVAFAYVARIKTRCERVGFVPLGGVIVPDIGDVRMVPFERTAVIFYRVTADAVEITNVFYGGRNYRALIK